MKIKSLVSVFLAALLFTFCIMPSASAKGVYTESSGENTAEENVVTGASVYSDHVEVHTKTDVPAEAIAVVLDGSYSVKTFRAAALPTGIGTTNIYLDLSSLLETDSIRIILVNAVTLKPLCDVYSVDARNLSHQSASKGESSTKIAFIIKDASGAPVSGASAVAVNKQTGSSVSFVDTSDENGMIRASLPSGDYTVTASKSGFTSSVINVNVGSLSKASVITMNGNNGYVEYKRYIRDYEWYNSTAAAAEGECGENLTWSYNKATGELNIFGTGTMDDFERLAPWAMFSDDIRAINLESGVTSIGANAFKDCTALSEFKIPENIASIGEEAFLGCENLKTVVNESGLNVVEGSVTNGYVAYYATDVLVTIDDTVHSDDDDWSPIYKSIRPISARGDVGAVTRTYIGLNPGENYVVYSVTSLDTDVFSSDNLAYINQQKADSNGIVTFTSNCFSGDNYDIFLMGTGFVDISNAEVRMPLKIFNGNVQVASPEVTYGGEILEFGKDYYFEGDSFAAEAGTYDFSIVGLGKYGSEKSCQFTIASPDGNAYEGNGYKDGCIFLGWFDGPGDDAHPYLPSFEGDDIYAYPHWEDVPEISVETEDIYRAYGEGNTLSAGFNLLGAQIRYNENDNQNGLRFVSRISKALIAKLEALDGDTTNHSVTYGHYLKANMSPNAVLDATTGKKSEAASLLYNGKNYNTFSAVIYNIPEANCNTEISVRPYIEYTDANGNLQTYYFTEKEARNYNGAYHTTISRVAKYIVDYDTIRLNNSKPGLQEYIRHLADLYNGD